MAAYVGNRGRISSKPQRIGRAVAVALGRNEIAFNNSGTQTVRRTLMGGVKTMTIVFSGTAGQNGKTRYTTGKRRDGLRCYVPARQSRRRRPRRRRSDFGLRQQRDLPSSAEHGRLGISYAGGHCREASVFLVAWVWRSRRLGVFPEQEAEEGAEAPALDAFRAPGSPPVALGDDALLGSQRCIWARR